MTQVACTCVEMSDPAMCIHSISCSLLCRHLALQVESIMRLLHAFLCSNVNCRAPGV